MRCGCSLVPTFVLTCCSLKSSYSEYHKQLGETGHGLITTGCENEIRTGSEIENIYGRLCMQMLRT